MKGGLTFYRGSGKEARNYIEADHHTPRRADEYYLAEGEGIAPMTRISVADGVTERVMLDGDTYEKWVEGYDVRTGAPKGKVIKGGEDRKALRFCEININCPKSLSLVAAIHPDISQALDAAQDSAAQQLNALLVKNVTTRIGPQGAQEQVHVDEIEVVSVVHQTSRAGDPHRHIHHQVNARVLVDGKYRGLDSKAMLAMTRMVNGVGERVILAHPELRQALARHGYTLTRDGEVSQLASFVPAMSKRTTQVTNNIARYEREWRALNPGEEPGAVLTGEWKRAAWNDGRQAKNKRRLAMPGELVDQGWRTELRALGVDLDALYTAGPVRVQGLRPGEVNRSAVADRALAVLSAGANGRSAWNVYDVRGAVEETLSRQLVHGDAAVLSELADDIAARVSERCLSTDPTHTALPDHIRHLTSQAVVDLEKDISGRLAVRSAQGHQPYTGAVPPALDPGQAEALRALAGTGMVVMVEGAAGAGKTKMLAAAAAVLEKENVTVQVVAPSRKAAIVAAAEIGTTDANTAHGLVYAYGYRWDTEGVWSRLSVGDRDPVTGQTYTGPSEQLTLSPRHLVVVDEAGMLDQDCARALLTVADEAGARIGFVGDRQQLPAVGRGGTLDMVAAWAPAQVEMSAVHRFRQRVEVEPGRIVSAPDLEYAQLSLAIRSGQEPEQTFDALVARGDVRTHASQDAAIAALADQTADLLIANAALPRGQRQSQSLAVGTNEAAERINTEVRRRLVTAELVDNTRTVTGADGIQIGKGDLVQTRTNDRDQDVLNREVWTVRGVGPDGSVRLQNEQDRRFSEVSQEYCLTSVQHAYACTAHGVQGVTADRGVALLEDSTDAPGLYVPMTRGRYSNTIHVVAEDLDSARAQWVEASGRNRADLGLESATQAARVEAADYQLLPAAQKLRDAIDRLQDRLNRPHAALSDRELADQAAVWRSRQRQAVAGKQAAERFIREHGADIEAGHGPATVKAQQQVEELRNRAQQAQAARHAQDLQAQVRLSALQVASKERELQNTTGLFAGKQRKALTAEIEALRTMHAERQSAAAVAAAQVRPAHQVHRTDMSPERIEEVAAQVLEKAARTDEATLRLRQQAAQRCSTQIKESAGPLEQFDTELAARAKDPSLSVPDDPQVLAEEAQQRLQQQARSYDDYSRSATEHHREISL